jgi:predicted DNA-binding transcriptional regulator AlpA
MDIPTRDDGVAICSVTEMASKLGMSRARLYQLVDKGVFPPPVRSGTHRPFYSSDLQERCLRIRKTGIGLHGRPVLFNKPRTRRPARSKREGPCQELAAALKSMGLKVTAKAVKEAIGALYPAGLDKSQHPDEILRDLFRHFHPDCQNDVKFV